MAEAWTYVEKKLQVQDENGFAVAKGVLPADGRTIASAPRLAEQVRILREALAGLCDSQLTSRDREDAITRGLAAIEATKET